MDRGLMGHPQKDRAYAGYDPPSVFVARASNETGPESVTRRADHRCQRIGTIGINDDGEEIR